MVRPVMPLFRGNLVSKGPVLVAILTNKPSVLSEIVRVIGKMRIGGGGIARVSCVGADDCACMAIPPTFLFVCHG